ncbi:uncharacterized protein LOC141629833 [Silene latifolia]|uniref:uncharacterized protein LOC141629833 n=1 Tax=Silene latifolia TaxID=37657 RepID=UPI003D77F214
MKNPGGFFITCTIGNKVIDKALCDLGASVSVIPYSVCKKLNMGLLKMANITLQMADRSVRRPLGILEDVPVKVVGDDTITFSLPGTLVRPMIEDTCYSVDIVDESVYEFWSDSLIKDQVEALMLLDECADNPENNDVVLDLLEAVIDERVLTDSEGERVEQLVNTLCAMEVKVSERKTLSSHLKYSFLDNIEHYPVIVSAKLDDKQLTALLVVLKKNRKVMGYSLADIQGIGPDICMHKIELEEDHKPCRQVDTSTNHDPWYADLGNYVVSGELPPDLSYQQRKRFLYNANQYVWDYPYLFKKCADGLYRRCIP